MNDVNAETGFVTDMYVFYSSALVGGAAGLMYHNLNMGISGSQTAKQAIYDPFSIGASGTNLNLSGWYNYTQGATGIMDVNLINTNLDNEVLVTMYLRDPSGTAPTWDYFVANFTLQANNGSNVGLTNYDTGVIMDSTNFPTGVYQIAFDLTATYIGPPPPPPPPPVYPPVINNTTTASDTDGVGAGLPRVITNPPNFVFGGTPITGAPLVRGTITGNDGIYINKRTTFTLTFNY